MALWTTKDEIEFLDGLKKRNPEAFQNYKDTLNKRTKWETRWGSIDPERVADFLLYGPEGEP